MSDEVTPEETAPQDEALSPPDVSVEETWDECVSGSDGELVIPSGKPKPVPSFWQRVRDMLFGNSGEVEQRLRDLGRAIENFPDTPANYVLRGEIYLDIAEYELAGADFRRALELATAQFETSDWGGIAQAMRDRAEIGLAKAHRRLQ